MSSPTHNLLKMHRLYMAYVLVSGLESDSIFFGGGFVITIQYKYRQWIIHTYENNSEIIRSLI